MTENEAIEVLKDFDKQVAAKADGAYQSTIGKMACKVAVTALEEIQQYRALETAEELKHITENKAISMMQEHLELLDEYKELGTVEELREAMEKQKAKKTKHQGCFDNKGVWHGWNGVNGKPYEICPNCETNLCCEMPHDTKPKYCKNCGQAID